MSKRYHRNDLDEIDEVTVGMLGSRHAKIASANAERHSKGRHERDDAEFHASVRKAKKAREHLN